MQVKGLELPRQEPRFAKGFGLGHATSNRGADHLYGLPAIDLAGAWDVANRLFPAEIVPELMDPANEKYKADMVVYGEHFCAVTDALGICKFSTIEEYALFPEDLAPGVAALWGRPVTGADLLLVGERIVNLERLYNVRQGFPVRTTACRALHHRAGAALRVRRGPRHRSRWSVRPSRSATACCTTSTRCWIAITTCAAGRAMACRRRRRWRGWAGGVRRPCWVSHPAAQDGKPSTILGIQRHPRPHVNLPSLAHL